MELWIRSQDKTALLKTNDLFLDHKQQKSTISTYSNRGYTIILGFYNNDERALEVLDDIEQLLMFTQGTGFTDFSGNALFNVNNNLAIYEMPKE